MTRWEKYSVLEDFVRAFESLGTEIRGMTPEAASLLPSAAAEYHEDPTKGYRPILSGVPASAVVSEGEKILDIRCAYPKCEEFWNIDLDRQLAQITQEGVEYVEKHFDIFKILLGER